MKKIRFTFIFLTISIIPFSTFAYEITDSLSINTFGTIGVSTNDSNDIQYRPKPGHQSSISKGEIDWTNNTIVGLQANYEINDYFSLTAQGRVKNVGDDSYQEDLTWGYLKYDSDSNISFRIGKFQFPIFKSAELQNVGYARTYIRPPLITTGIGGYHDFTAIQVYYNTLFNEFDINMQASYGQSKSTMPELPNGDFDSVESDNIKIISSRIGKHNYWLNISYTHLNTDVTTIFANTSTMTTPGSPPTPGSTPSGSNNSRSQTNSISMLALEWQVRLSGAIIEGGYGRGKVGGRQPDEGLFYSSIAYPINNISPYFLYSRRHFTNISTQPGAPAAPKESYKDELYSLGFRYDISPGVALKLQWDHILSGANISISNNLIQNNGSHNAIHFTIDWMF